MLFEIHMLKNYPPTNLNRDDTGSPKSCIFGGTQRGRISSQSLKRAWRMSERFEKLLQKPGIRTRHLPDLVAEKLAERGMAKDIIEAWKSKITGIANKKGTENPKGRTSQIIIYAPDDIEAVADMVQTMNLDEFAEKEEVNKKKKSNKEGPFEKKFKEKEKEVEDRSVTLDIALFGRMVTAAAFRNVEAAMQVAHAISTHTVTRESDFYTAVDDWLEAKGKTEDESPEENVSNDGNVNESGAGMMGDIDFNSCCYYIYAAIDSDKLTENLKDSPDKQALIDCVLPGIVEVMAFSNPSGKQNSFAGHIFPDLLIVEVKDDNVPASYANAFAEPAKIGYAREKGEVGLVADSVQKLAAEIDMMKKAYSLEVKHRAWFCPRYESIAPLEAEAEIVKSFTDMKELLTAWGRGE
ncbi:type I-E CRISPR-associated protein Cas7/Cse4/CasC [Synergistales bacterium]|nr:type I-E CRISPR-associated protein Cas7/Cse4/CasC [Synergistales bacterium]